MIHNPYSWYGSLEDFSPYTRRRLDELCLMSAHFSDIVEQATKAHKQCVENYSLVENSFVSRIALLEKELDTTLQDTPNKIIRLIALRQRIDELTHCIDELTHSISKPCFNQIRRELQETSKKLEALSEEYRDLRAKLREQTEEPVPAEAQASQPACPVSKQGKKPGPKRCKKGTDLDISLLATWKAPAPPQQKLPSSDHDLTLVDKIRKVAENLSSLINQKNMKRYLKVTPSKFSVFLSIGSSHWIGEKAEEELYRRIDSINEKPISDSILTPNPSTINKLMTALLSSRQGLELFKLRIQETTAINLKSEAEFELKQGQPTPSIPSPPPSTTPIGHEQVLKQALVIMSNVIKNQERGIFTFSPKQEVNFGELIETSTEWVRQIGDVKALRSLSAFALQERLLDAVWEKLTADPTLYLHVRGVSGDILCFSIPRGMVKPSLGIGKDGHCEILPRPLPRPPVRT